MKQSGEITVEQQGRQYGATYSVKDGMLLVKTHTETRSIQVGDQEVEELARQALREIISAQPST